MTRLITLVTGSSRGIGRALAAHYLEQGHQVIGFSRHPFHLNHDRYHHHIVDMADESSLRAAFAKIEKQFQRLDHLINNAGISHLNHSLLMPIETARKIFDVNYFGTYIASQEAARLMKKNNLGRIVNFSSVAVKMASDGLSAYASSKAAVEELTKIMAKEFQPLGITVNCVAPSFVETDLSRGIPPAHRGAENKMADVLHAVDSLLSTADTGQILYL
jgi:3-oxoacyl-[acyl-carrier protein] reductase